MREPVSDSPYTTLTRYLLGVMGLGAAGAGRNGKSAPRAAGRVVEEAQGWGAPLGPALDGLEEQTRRALGEAWAKDGLAERASIVSFARFVTQLLAAAAPAELVVEAHRAMGDEIRHAEMCFGLASAYLGMPVGPGELVCQDENAVGGDLVALTRVVVREGAIGETIASLCAAEAAANAEDPVVRGVLASIARDETAHAALAWRFLAFALGRGDGDEEVSWVIEEELEAASFACTSSMIGDAGDSKNELRAHGRLSPKERRVAARRAMDEVILPCARELLVASRWITSRKRAMKAPALAS